MRPFFDSTSRSVVFIAQGRTVNLPPMSAYERRLVHIALRDDARIDTHSEGTDPERRVVITVR